MNSIGSSIGHNSGNNLGAGTKSRLVAQAQQILRENDYGSYTIPSDRLYPFQWYWDSVICALGWQTFDEARAWQEMECLHSCIDNKGFLPHIVFHKDSEDYFPGPEFWRTDKQNPPGSLISQPPILTMGYWNLYRACEDKKKYIKVLREAFDKLCQHHLWWADNRQRSESLGLVAAIHPWETGMDNSPAWYDTMDRIPTFAEDYERKDTSLIDPKERPVKAEYDRYLYIVDLLRKGTPGQELAQNGPFSVHDLCIISLLHRSNKDLCLIAEEIGADVPAKITDFMENTAKNIDKLWIKRGKYSYFATWNALEDKPIEVKISACFLPLYAELASKSQAEELHTLIKDVIKDVQYCVPSTAKDEESYDSCRYWCGPVWFHINWMIAQGLINYGFEDTAAKIRQSTLRLAEERGFYEYYDSGDGRGCGGGNFSWTAATYLLWC